MRYVRCHECGSAEVPALATCPECGIKTPVEVRRRWWAMPLTLAAGAALGLAVGYACRTGGEPGRSAGRPGPTRTRPAGGAERLATGDEAAARLEKDLARVLGERDALRRELERLRAAQRSAGSGVPSAASVPPDENLWRLRLRWATSFLAAARLWREPFVPVTYLPVIAEEVDRLEEASAALSAERDAAEEARRTAADLARHLAALRNALAPEKHHRLTVSAQADWSDSGVAVEAGDLVYLRAEGAWTTAVGGAEQERPTPQEAEPLPLVDALPVGALLWRVGDSPHVHAVSTEGPSLGVRSDAGGTLHFRINEQRLEDNAGAVAVEVVVVPGRVTRALEEAASRIIPR